MNRILFALVSLATILSSCNSRYEVSGKSSFQDMDGSTVYARKFTDGEWITIDSAEVVHGKFSMNGRVDSVVLATLFIGSDALMPVVLEKGKIDVTISDTELTAKGTQLNDALYSFVERRNKFDEQLTALDRKETTMIMDGGDIDEIHRQLAEEEQQISAEMDEYVNKFISDNYENVLGPGIFMMLCSSLPYPIMTPQLEKIIDEAPYSFKMDSRVKSFVAAAKENMQLIEENRRMQSNRQ